MTRRYRFGDLNPFKRTGTRRAFNASTYDPTFNVFTAEQDSFVPSIAPQLTDTFKAQVVGIYGWGPIDAAQFPTFNKTLNDQYGLDRDEHPFFWHFYVRSTEMNPTAVDSLLYNTQTFSLDPLNEQQTLAIWKDHSKVAGGSNAIPIKIGDIVEVRYFDSISASEPIIQTIVASHGTPTNVEEQQDARDRYYGSDPVVPPAEPPPLAPQPLGPEPPPAPEPEPAPEGPPPDILDSDEGWLSATETRQLIPARYQEQLHNQQAYRIGTNAEAIEYQRGGMDLGIDVSHNNPDLDWRLFKESGVKFAYIKVSEGAGMKDRKAAQWAQMAKANGIPFGWYHYAQPYLTADDQRLTNNASAIRADADEEVDNFLETARRLRGQGHVDQLPLCLDWEEFSNNALGDDQPAPIKHEGNESVWILHFLRGISESSTGKPVVYTGHNSMNWWEAARWDDEDQRELSEYSLWIPRYTHRNPVKDGPKPWGANTETAPIPWTPHKWTIFQFTGAGIIPGSGTGPRSHAPIDLNVVRPEFLRSLGIGTE